MQQHEPRPVASPHGKARPLPSAEVDALRLNLSGRDLSKYGAALHAIPLSGANLSGALLAGVDLRGRNLYGTDLTGANLRGADLSRTDLRNTDLTGASLVWTRLEGTHLRGDQAEALHAARADVGRARVHGPEPVPQNLRREIGWMREGPLLAAAERFTVYDRFPAALLAERGSSFDAQRFPLERVADLPAVHDRVTGYIAPFPTLQEAARAARAAREGAAYNETRSVHQLGLAAERTMEHGPYRAHQLDGPGLHLLAASIEETAALRAACYESAHAARVRALSEGALGRNPDAVREVVASEALTWKASDDLRALVAPDVRLNEQFALPRLRFPEHLRTREEYHQSQALQESMLREGQGVYTVKLVPGGRAGGDAFQIVLRTPEVSDGSERWSAATVEGARLTQPDDAMRLATQANYGEWAPHTVSDRAAVVEISGVLETHGALRKANAVVDQLAEASGRAALAERSLVRSERQLDAALQRTFQDPRAVRAMFEAAADKHRFAQALRHAPHSVAALREASTGGLHGLLGGTSARTALQHAREAAQHAASVVEHRKTLTRCEQELGTLCRRVGAETPAQALGSATQHAQALRAQVDRMPGLSELRSRFQALPPAVRQDAIRQAPALAALGRGGRELGRGR